jgi:hypothetical protein
VAFGLWRVTRYGADLSHPNTGQLSDGRQRLAAILHPRNCGACLRAMVGAPPVALCAHLLTDLGASRSVCHASISLTRPVATMNAAASSTLARSRCARASLARACASRTRRRASTFDVFVAMAEP